MKYDTVHATNCVFVTGAAATAEMDFRRNRVRLCKRVGDEVEGRFVATGCWVVPRDFTAFFRLAAMMADGRVEM